MRIHIDVLWDQMIIYHHAVAGQPFGRCLKEQKGVLQMPVLPLLTSVPPSPSPAPSSALALLFLWYPTKNNWTIFRVAVQITAS